MRQALAHRGPDRSAMWALDAVGLGQCMLETTPEAEHEVQPMAMDASTGRVRPPGTDENDLVLTADARIDNRDELIGGLDLRDRDPARVSDGELILRSYLKWGAGAPGQLLGDFAFAIWDPQARTVVCARDPMGVKPFYYFHAPRRFFAFASEIKGLLALTGVPREIEPSAVALHIERQVDRELTLYHGIKKLAAATVGRFDSDGGADFEGYWKLEEIDELSLPTDEAYAEAFRNEFTRAVRVRCRIADGRGRLGSTLSGGLDSSSIACAAHDVVGADTVHTFSAVFPGLPDAERHVVDETEYIEAVLATRSFVPHFVRADRIGPLDDLDGDLEEQDGAHFAGNLYIHRALFGAARDAGVRVMLEGSDGDSTVGYGYDRLFELADRRDWSELTREVGIIAERNHCSAESLLSRYVRPSMHRMARSGRAVSWLRAARRIRADLGVPGRRLAIRYGLAGLRPVRGIASERSGRTSANAERSTWMSEDFSRIVRSDGRRSPPDERERMRWTNSRTWQRESVLDPALQYLLEACDRISAPRGMEVRYPFCDRRLIEFCVALPAHQRLSEGWTRAIHRRASADLLPDIVRWRTAKQRLSPNTIRGLRDRNGEVLQATLRSTSRSFRRFADAGVIEKVLQEFMQSREVGRREEESGFTLFQATTLARWLERMDQAPPAASGHDTHRVA